MKLIYNGKVSLQAETAKEVERLVKISNGEDTPKRKHYKRTCRKCGQRVRGAIGLGIHMRKAHGIKAE